jgi:hypothetical protein
VSLTHSGSFGAMPDAGTESSDNRRKHRGHTGSRRCSETERGPWAAFCAAQPPRATHAERAGATPHFGDFVGHGPRPEAGVAPARSILCLEEIRVCCRREPVSVRAPIGARNRNPF